MYDPSKPFDKNYPKVSAAFVALGLILIVAFAVAVIL